ncbi:ATP-binding protein [Jeotgalibacillus terrae]|uniref:ATP-binding protein n=1 Tax=Jeotgalibacillus terrae TaxID=587735 RepID=A0ABW5ZCB6_9BACL|nr:ATP-binding protein [Jeotgalibacillus terrae]MBM7577770.1 anti-sigma regulatory factor (Ser/Thr protein kinase) [Jeotgalibacillus terrae]
MRWLLSLLMSRLRSGRSAVPPSDQPLVNLLHGVKTGYLAMEIAGKLSYKKKERNKLFYKAILLNPQALRAHEDVLLSAGAKLLEWDMKGEDLPEKITHFNAEKEVIKAMLDVHFDHKNDLFLHRVFTEQTKKREQKDEWFVYRDVLAAATHNKLILIEPHQVEAFKEGHILSEGWIEERSDISKIRNEARKCFEERDYSKSATMSFLLVLSEAMTNVFKHAEHGKVTIVEDHESAIHFIVEDSGTGIPLEQLPKATLLTGYSTQKSMGQGFTVMLKIASFIHLHTSEEGSALVLTFEHPDKTEISRQEQNTVKAVPQG